MTRGMKQKRKRQSGSDSGVLSGKPGSKAEGSGVGSGSLTGSEPQLQPGTATNRRWIVGDGTTASPAGPMSSRPLPRRCKPYPSDGSDDELHKWLLERKENEKLNAEDAAKRPPTLRKWKVDPDTAEAVSSPRDKDLIMRVACSIVGISSIAPDGEVSHFTGIIKGEFEASERARIFTYSGTVCTYEGELVERKLLVHLWNNKSLEAHLLFVDPYYEIAILELEVSADIKLWGPSFAPPKYGEEVFVLARDEESILSARHGRIKWLEQTYTDRNHYMFLCCEFPKGGRGGLVIDKDGNATGMVLKADYHELVILSSSIILKCLEMQNKYSCIARPIHGLDLMTVGLLDVSQSEQLSRIGINAGYVVNEVSIDSTVEKLGIRDGDVIESFDRMGFLSLPELEVSLLSVGCEFLDKNLHPSSKVVFKLQFCDLQGNRSSIDLPVGFSCSPSGPMHEVDSAAQDVDF